MNQFLIYLFISMPLMGLDHTGLYDRNVDIVKQKRKRNREQCRGPERPYYYAPQPTEQLVTEELCLDDLEDEEDD